MNSRFAQILASCTDDQGQVDRAQLFKALSVLPDDPAAVLLEAAAVSQEHLTEIRQLIEKATADLKLAVDAHTAAARTMAVFQEEMSRTAEKTRGELENALSEAHKAVIDETVRPMTEEAVKTIETVSQKALEALTEISAKVEQTRKIKIGVIWLIGLFLGVVAGGGTFAVLRYLAHRFIAP